MSSNRFRQIALGLPGVIEGSHQGHADFRAGKRIFATLGYPDKDWGMVKLTPEQQSVLVEAEPTMFRPVPAAGASKAAPMCGSPKPIRRPFKAPSRLPGPTSRRSRCSRSLRSGADFASHQSASLAALIF
jgi:hypothetical protein